VQANGRWVRSLWLSRYTDGRFDRLVAQQELGAWTAGDTAYEFTSDADGRRFSVPPERPNGVLRLPLRSVRDGYIDATLRPVPPPASIVGSYALTNAHGATPPAVVEVFPDVELDGRRVSVHFLVDSARVQPLGNQRYEHRIWSSEWEGPSNGAPAVRRLAYRHSDFGTWTRDETLLRFESGWLQNHRVLGTTYGPSAIELLHGLAPGDAAVPFRYRRE